MKNMLVLALFLAFGLIATDALAQETHLQDTIAAIDDEGISFDGEIAVKDGIKQTFNVDDSTIKALRKQGLGYGVISALLAMSEKMTGGIIDANMEEILSAHGDARDKSFGYLAGHFKIDFDAVIGRVDQTEKAIRELEQVRNVEPPKNTCGKSCYAPWGNAQESGPPPAGTGGAGGGAPSGY